MWRIWVTVLALASGVIAQSCGTTREISAGLADATVFPWVGLVYFRNHKSPAVVYGSATATGVLIDNRHVLMSDYITSSVKEEELYVQFGVTDANNVSSHHNHTVDKIIIHPNSFPNYITNVILLRLREPVHFSEQLSPVCLPNKNQDYDDDNLFYISYKLRGSGNEKKKEIINLPTVNSTDCEELYKEAWSLISPANSDSYICGGSIGDSESCHLDETISPLFRKTSAGWTVTGLYHFGPRKCGSGLPAAFINVRVYRSWIRTVLAS